MHLIGIGLHLHHPDVRGVDALGVLLKSATSPPDVEDVRSTLDFTGDVPEQATLKPRRFPITSRVVISRSRSAVWREYAQLDHPAWSECPENEDPQLRVGNVVGLAVGAARMSVMPPTGNNGIRNILYSEIRQVIAGHSVTNECVFTNNFELTETIQFADHPSPGTLVEITIWCNTVPMAEAHAERLQRNLQRIQLGYLNRAKSWAPGIGHRPNVVEMAADDPPYRGRHA